jgi:hypothetical protein
VRCSPRSKPTDRRQPARPLRRAAHQQAAPLPAHRAGAGGATRAAHALGADRLRTCCSSAAAST